MSAIFTSGSKSTQKLYWYKSFTQVSSFGSRNNAMIFTRKRERGCKAVVSERRLDQKLIKLNIIFSCTWQLSGSRPLTKQICAKQTVWNERAVSCKKIAWWRGFVFIENIYELSVWSCLPVLNAVGLKAACYRVSTGSSVFLFQSRGSTRSACRPSSKGYPFWLLETSTQLNTWHWVVAHRLNMAKYLKLLPGSKFSVMPDQLRNKVQNISKT